MSRFSAERIKRFLFENNSVRQIVLKNTFWLSASEIGGRILRAGIVIYAARVLGAEGLGIFSYAVSLSALFSIFADLGLGSVLIREGAKSAEARKKYFGTAFVIRFWLTVVSAALIFWGAPLMTKIPLSSPLLFFTVLVFIFDSFRGFNTSLFRSAEKMEWETAVNMATQAAVLAAGFLALNSSETPEALAAAYAVGSGVGFAFAVYFARSHMREIWRSFDRSLVRKIVSAAWPFSVAGILGAVMINTDTIMLGWFRGAVEVGYYSAAQKPILLLYIIPSFLAGGFFPAFARFANTDNDRFRSLLEKGLATVFLCALPLTIGLILVAEAGVALLYGAEYAPAVLPLKILSLTLLMTYPMSFIANSIFAYNKQKTLIVYGIIGAASNALLDILLIPNWGMEGSAWATVITQIIGNTFLWLTLKKINNFGVLPQIRKMIFASLVMGLVIIGAQTLALPLLLIIPIGLVSYLATLFALKERLFGDLKAILG